MSRIRVLLIAEAANPEWSSVPLVGWSHASALREVADVHLVTHVRNKEAIERAGLRDGFDFTAIDSEAFDAPLYKFATWLRGGNQKGWTIDTAIQSIRNYYFQYLVWKRFARDVKNGKYQIVHQITPLSPTTPNLVAGCFRRAGAKFIWGPINGGVPWPVEFDSVRRKEREWLAPLRSAYKLLPGFGSVRRNASALIVASKDTLDQMPDSYRNKCIYMPENGIDPARFNNVRTRDYSIPIRVGFVGRLVPYKGGDMLIEALATLVQSGRLVIDFFGDGPERNRLEEMVELEGLINNVIFHGNIEHAHLQEKLGACDILGFPSIREFGGGVVLEAMALGVVPVVVGYGGPNELVTDETGYRVPIGSRASIINGFRRLFEDICDNPAQLEGMSIRSREHINMHYTWKAKARQVMKVYEWVLGGCREEGKPSFGMFKLGELK